MFGGGCKLRLDNSFLLFVNVHAETQSPSIKDIQRESEDLPSLSNIQSNESLDSWSGSSAKGILSSSVSLLRPGQDDDQQEGPKRIIKKNSELARKGSLANIQQRKSLIKKSLRLWKSLDIDPN